MPTHSWCTGDTARRECFIGGDQIPWPRSRNAKKSFDGDDGSILKTEYDGKVLKGLGQNVDWYNVMVYPFKEGLSVYFTVTTENKKAEEKRKIERDKAEQYLDIVGNIIVSLDNNGIIPLKKVKQTSAQRNEQKRLCMQRKRAQKQ